ncbi:MAG: PH domain-containing protein [Micromonosporaceae bacterium]
MSSDNPRDDGERDRWDTEPVPPLPSPPAPPDEPRYRDSLVEGPPEPPPMDTPPPPPPLPDPAEAELDGFRYDAAGLPVGPRRVLPLEPEPSALISRYLFPTERFRGEWRRHWVHLFPYGALGVGATFVMGYLSGVLASFNLGNAMTIVVIIWLAVLGWSGWQFVDWYFDRFILTNKRVMVIAGVVTRHVAMMPLLRVTDMKYEQSPMGRMLNYGTFVMESAGQDQALREIKHLPNPNELYLRVCEEMYEPEAVEARLGEETDEEHNERLVGDA